MDGSNATILSVDTGKEYHLSLEEVEAFNAKYNIVLQESTQEALTNSLIDTQIEQLQNDFVHQKETLIDTAKDIAEVTVIAEEIENAGEERKIQLNAYAAENSLTEISEETVNTFNNTIEDMVSTSRTANMLEQYRGAIVESTTFITQSSQTTQAFYDQAVMQADSYHNNLNIEWENYQLSVEGGFWQVVEQQPVMEPRKIYREIGYEG